MTALRAFIFIDQMQPGVMCCLGTFLRGFLPRSRTASLIVEVAPGLDIESLTDVALKTVEVSPGILAAERQYGYLEAHSRQTAAIKSAGAAMLDAMGADEKDAMPPEILASKVINRIDDRHAALINRNRQGSMTLPGESVHVLEMRPSSYCVLAANEAEKAANIKIVDCRMIGATGRLYVSGSEGDVRAAAQAAESALIVREE